MEREGLEVEPTLQNVTYARAFNSDHQIYPPIIVKEVL